MPGEAFEAVVPSPWVPGPMLEAAVLGRSRSFLEADYRRRVPEIEAAITGSRVLVVGGAGSIGAATTELMCMYSPAALHVVDTNENALAELVRDLRSRGLELRDLRALPLDYGGAIAARLLREAAPYDIVLNFAALKHVRSEKDVPSLLQMLDTNVVKQMRFRTWLERHGHGRRYFAVSTDKAAMPTSLMGASKRLMEDVIFSSTSMIATSSRFANVAFSNGSLLQSFLIRLAKRQPLFAPRDTRRYFISLREAGQLCLLAAATAPDRHVLIPRVAPDIDLSLVETMAVRTLRHFGLEPAFYDEAAKARENVAVEMARARYPLVLTPLDTAGEKAYEEFVADDESTVDLGLERVLAVVHRAPPRPALLETLAALEAVIDDPTRTVTKADLVATIGRIVPGFQHRETGTTLDDRA